MSGTVLENLSGKKLAILVSCFLICQLVCFLVGGLIAPKPSFTDSILGSKCIDDNRNVSWFYIRGKEPCKVDRLDTLDYESDNLANANQVVFTFQIPSPREGVMLDYSRWQQNLIGILHLEILYHPENEMPEKTEVTIDAKLGYKNKEDEDWNFYASSLEQRSLQCTIQEKKEGYPYNCSIVPLFELGSLHHDYYLINIRLPVDFKKQYNTKLGHLVDIWLFAINQTGGFTKVWVALKCIFFPAIIAILVWFWKRIFMLQRKPLLLEYTLLVLGIAMSILNAPLELLSLIYEMPYMLLLGDIRQGIFYAALLSFWLIFAGEHLMIQPSQKNHIRAYWPHLSCVITGCIALLLFDLCERGYQLRNPFSSIWVTDTGTKIAMILLVVGAISGVVYFIVLCCLIWKVFRNISTKRASLPAMSQARRLHYSGIIYRFNFLMVVTVICAAMTMIEFSLGQISEGQLKWEERPSIEYSSAFFTGVYGMWNIYIFALLVLYAPSHKQWPSQSNGQSQSNEMEFSCLNPEPSEVSSLTFVSKAALD